MASVAATGAGWRRCRQSRLGRSREMRPRHTSPLRSRSENGGFLHAERSISEGKSSNGNAEKPD